MSNNVFKCLVVLVWLFFLVHGSSQGQGKPFENHKREADTTAYFIDLLEDSPSDMKELQGEFLNLSFTDRYARKGEFVLHVYSWDRKLLKSMELKKKYGANYYKISRTVLIPGFQEGQEYALEVKNDRGQKYRSYFKFIPDPPTDAPQVEIMVNPISVDCQDAEENLVEFYGKISGGKAPFKIKWEVLGGRNQNDLFQPREDEIPVQGYTTAIQVNIQPTYHIVFNVVDACGNIGQQRLVVSCNEETKRSNTLLFQRLKKYPVREVTN